MGIMNIFAIVTGVVLITITAGSIIASFRCLNRIDPDILFISITTLICGVAAILAGIYLK